MIRYIFILFFAIFTLISANVSYAACENSCGEDLDKNSSSEIANDKALNEEEDVSKSLFNYTKASVDIKNIEGVSIYTINQNQDTRYNMGYVLGKTVLLNHPDYSKDLRKYLDQYVQEQSQFKLDDVVESISKSLPCWLAEEMRGFADAINTPDDGVDIGYKDIVMLNSVVLWTRLPQKPPKTPPAAPTSVKPITLKKSDFRKLSPVSPVSDQVAFVVSLASSEVEGNYPLVGKTYKRNYYDFFDKYPGVFVYNLNNNSFINVGFAGLLTVMSAMNNDGIVINTVQAPYQKNMSVVGSTPPNVSARIAIEISDSLSECEQVLNTQVSSIEMTYIVNDDTTHKILDSNIANGEESKNEVIIEQNKYYIFNIRNETIVKHIRKVLQAPRLENKTVNLNDFINILTSRRMYDINLNVRPEALKSVFSVVYCPAMKIVYVTMPPIVETDDYKKLIKLDFESVDLFSFSNVEETKDSEYYDKYKNNDEEQ